MTAKLGERSNINAAILAAVERAVVSTSSAIEKAQAFQVGHVCVVYGVVYGVVWCGMCGMGRVWDVKMAVNWVGGQQVIDRVGQGRDPWLFYDPVEHIVPLTILTRQAVLIDKSDDSFAQQAFYRKNYARAKGIIDHVQVSRVALADCVCGVVRSPIQICIFYIFFCEMLELIWCGYVSCCPSGVLCCAADAVHADEVQVVANAVLSLTESCSFAVAGSEDVEDVRRLLLLIYLYHLLLPITSS